MGKSLISCFLTDGSKRINSRDVAWRCDCRLSDDEWLDRDTSTHRSTPYTTSVCHYGPFSPFPPNRTPFSFRSIPPFLFSLFLVSVSSFLLPPPLSSLLLLFPPLSFTDCQRTSRQQTDKRWGRHKHAQMNAVNRRTTSAWWRHRCRHEFISVHNVVPTALHTFIPSSRRICTSSASPSFLYNRLLRIYV